MIKYNYLTEKEIHLDRKGVNTQIAIGLQTCKTPKDVCELLNDIRQHERQLIKSDKEPTQAEKEVEGLKVAGVLAYIGDAKQ